MHLSTFNSEAVAIRRFALHAASFLAIQVLIAAAISWPFISHLPQTYMAVFNDKQHRLETAPGPRLVLVGSSNVALSFDSTGVKEKLKLEAVNMGVHQGLGLELVLNGVARNVQKGDVVLVSLEYAHFRADLTTDIILEALIAAPRATISGLDYRRFQKLPDQVLALLGRRTRTLALAALGKMDFRPSDPYARSSFNELGDDPAHRTMAPWPGRQKGIPFRYSVRVDDVVEALNEFAQVCRDRGVTPFYSHPPYPQFEFDRDRKDLEQLHQTLTTRLSFPVISTPAETVYPDNAFYDTEYHTLLEGTRLRTELVLQRLGERLKN